MNLSFWMLLWLPVAKGSGKERADEDWKSECWSACPWSTLLSRTVRHLSVLATIYQAGNRIASSRSRVHECFFLAAIPPLRTDDSCFELGLFVLSFWRHTRDIESLCEHFLQLTHGYTKDIQWIYKLSVSRIMRMPIVGTLIWIAAMGNDPTKSQEMLRFCQ